MDKGIFSVVFLLPCAVHKREMKQDVENQEDSSSN